MLIYGFLSWTRWLWREVAKGGKTYHNLPLFARPLFAMAVFATLSFQLFNPWSSRINIVAGDTPSPCNIYYPTESSIYRGVCHLQRKVAKFVASRNNREILNFPRNINVFVKYRESNIAFENHYYKSYMLVVTPLTSD